MKDLVRLVHICGLISIGIVLLLLLYLVIGRSGIVGGMDSFEAVVIILLFLAYAVALPLGLIGCVLSIILLVRERRARTKHSVFAICYLALWTVVFSWTYYVA